MHALIVCLLFGTPATEVFVERHPRSALDLFVAVDCRHPLHPGPWWMPAPRAP